MINSRIGDSLEDLFNQAVDYAVENKIDTIIIFAKGIKNVLRLKEIISDNDIKLIATTFPVNQVIYIENEEGEIDEVYPDIYREESKKMLEEQNITLVAGTMPLDPIITPGYQDNPYSLIKRTFDLLSDGLELSVQSAMMTTDMGATVPGERVLSINVSGFVDIQTTNSRFLFHPDMGLKINQIIK